MNKYYFCFLIFLCVFITRFLLREQFPIVSDSIGYARGLVTYNIANNEPGFPGYFLYIVMARLINLFVHNEIGALTILSTIFSGAAGIVLLLIGTRIFNLKVGFITVLLFLSSSVFWFFGITALPYIVALFFHGLVILGIVNVAFGKSKHLIWIPLSLAILFGIRPHELVNVGLPFLYYLTLLKANERVKVFIYLATFCLIWFIPLLALTGGILGYVQLFLNAFADLHPPSLQNSRFYITTVLVSLFTSFTLALPLLLYPIFYRIKNNQLLFLTLWITPIALFQLAIKSDHPAHTLALLLPITIALGYFLERVFRTQLILALALAVLATYNVLYFFRGFGSANPPYISYSSIYKNDHLFDLKLAYIRQHFDPKTTLIISDHRQWRMVGYFLPQFTIYVFEDVTRKTPILQNKVYVATNHNANRFTRPNDFFVIPSSIKTLVFFENQFADWVVASKKEIISSEQLGVLTILQTKQYSRLSVGFHRIELVP